MDGEGAMGDEVWFWVLVALGALAGGLIGFMAVVIEGNVYHGRRWWRIW
jgi:hypothetical protein